jgi:predicted permease
VLETAGIRPSAAGTPLAEEGRVPTDHPGGRPIVIQSLLAELRLAARSLAKSPALTSIAVLTLAVGIGANTAIFTLGHAVLLAPLPYEQPDRLVRVFSETAVSTEFFDHLAERADSFEHLALAAPAAVSVTGDGRPEEVAAVKVTPEYFRVLGVEPELGSLFPDSARIPGEHRVAVLGHGWWSTRYGGDPGVVGSTVRLSGIPHTVIGVLPASFEPLYDGSDLWVPMAIDPADEAHWDWISYSLYGRLRDGATLARANAELAAAVESYEEVRPGYLSGLAETATVKPLLEHMTGNFRTTFLLLFAGVALVLLIACANLANLLLARLTGRRQELALRSALGAGSWRLIGHVLAESLVLSVAGGLVGLEAAWWSLRALVGLLPESMPRVSGVEVETPVLWFAFGLAMVTTLLVGVLPALRAARVDPRGPLGASSRSSSPRHHRLNRALVAGEVALAVVLVAAAGLLVKSFAAVHDVEPGFEPARVLTFQLAAPDDFPEGPRRADYFRQVAERVRAVPGVESAAVMNRPPMTPGDVGVAFSLQGRELPEGMRSVSLRLVSPEFTETLGIPVVAGRPLSPDDRTDAPAVGLINRARSRVRARIFYFLVKRSNQGASSVQSVFSRSVEPSGLASEAAFASATNLSAHSLASSGVLSFTQVSVASPSLSANTFCSSALSI